MCTYVDKNATDEMRKQLKGKNVAYAWKFVRVKNGSWYAPFWNILYSQTNKTGFAPKDVLVKDDYDSGMRYHEEGVFHLTITRQQARLLAKYKRKGHDKKNRCKVVKISYNPKDLVCIGSVGPFAKKIYNMPTTKDTPDSICVTKFKFVDKIK